MKNFERKLETGIERLQSFGQLYFTRQQLFYEFCRTLRSPFGLELKTAAAAFGLSAIPSFFIAKGKPKNAVGLLSASAFVLGSLTALRKIPQTLPLPIAWNEFENLLEDYLQKHRIEGLLEIEQNADFTPLISNDLTLYGLPNLLICESDEIAQMLRANQFHLQTPCGVLSLREAAPLPENFQKMLNRAENPQVFYLHDADSQSFLKLSNLRKNLLLNDEIPLRILGLRPIHAKRLHLFAMKNQSVSADLQEFNFLDESEKRWLLDGNSAEVAGVSPIRLMRVLRRLILRTQIPPSDWKLKLPDKNLGFM
jgi:hypothetical protein